MSATVKAMPCNHGPVMPIAAIGFSSWCATAGSPSLPSSSEEIVGEIEDEQDTPVSRFRRIGERRWSLSGLLRPDEAGDIAHVEMAEARESDTLGGLLTETLERFPTVGDSIDVEARDQDHRDADDLTTPVVVRLTVTRVDGHRVDRLVFAVLDSAPDSGDGADGVTRQGEGAADV